MYGLWEDGKIYEHEFYRSRSHVNSQHVQGFSPNLHDYGFRAHANAIAAIARHTNSPQLILSQALVRDGLKCIVNNWPDGECSGLFRGQETPRGPDGVNDTQCLVLVPINIAEEGGDDKVRTRPSTVAYFASQI